jgi:hypothetical protein
MLNKINPFAFKRQKFMPNCKMAVQRSKMVCISATPRDVWRSTAVVCGGAGVVCCGAVVLAGARLWQPSCWPPPSPSCSPLLHCSRSVPFVRPFWPVLALLVRWGWRRGAFPRVFPLAAHMATRNL